MRLSRLFVASLSLASVGLSAAPAHALATLTFDSSPIWMNRVGEKKNDVLNRQDCIGDAVARFSYAISGATGGVFEVWSGANCDKAENRSASSTTKTCARVAVGSTVAKSIDLHFREMVKGYGLTEDAGIAACDTEQGDGQQTRALFFVVYNLNDLMPLVTSVPVSWTFKYDIQAPPAPTNVTAQAGDLTIITHFTAVSGETNLLNYRFYCSPPGNPPVTSTGGSGGTDTGGAPDAATAGTAGTTGGTATGGTAGTDTGGTAGTDTGGTAGTDTSGTAGTGGTDTGGTAAATGGTTTLAGTAGTTATTAGTASAADPGCTSSTLVAGQPVPEGAVECGRVGALTATGGETDPVLKNDTDYVVAVATEDSANNVGVLSNLACAHPQDVTGFFEAYNEAGGEAGGGFCTFAPARRDAWATGIALLLAAGALWRRRK